MRHYFNPNKNLKSFNSQLKGIEFTQLAISFALVNEIAKPDLLVRDQPALCPIAIRRINAPVQ